MTRPLLYHVTALSNLALGYDKYSGRYDKSKLPRRTFPGQFFLLTLEELAVGIAKTEKLVKKLGLDGDRPVVLATLLPSNTRLHPNFRTGLGHYIEGDSISLDSVYLLSPQNTLIPLVNEEALAQSLRCLEPTLKSYTQLQPRTVSVLPVARACQAACKFCFSEASVSLEQSASLKCLWQIDALCETGASRGAERLVITGGGEPGLLPHREMLRIIRAGAQHFPKVVLITNGIHLARKDEADRMNVLQDYAKAGLSVLAISRHHYDAQKNARIMGVDTRTQAVLASLRGFQRQGPPSGSEAIPPSMKARLICVLQKGGVQDGASVRAYLDWAVDQGVEQVCFKELYVSTTLESAYHDAAANGWSRENQVPLSMLVSELQAQGFVNTSELPWGSPVFQGTWNGQRLSIAAYTEPSLTWERTQGIARSWNLMADGTVLASLEDPASDLSLDSTPTSLARAHIPIFAQPA